MEVTNIYLARHGQTDYNRNHQIQGRGIDASLNDTGRLQAQAVANHLKTTSIHRIYGSSLKRSLETAKVVAQMHRLELESHADLDEMDFGILEGQPIEDIQSDLEELHTNWKSGNLSFSAKDGESPEGVLKRAGERVDLIIKKHHGSNLLFVLHGRLIRILVSHWLGYGLAEMHRVPHTNGAIYHIQWDGKQFNPVYLNHTDHLNGTRV